MIEVTYFASLLFPLLCFDFSESKLSVSSTTGALAPVLAKISSETPDCILQT
jgi:hypothetical protein